VFSLVRNWHLLKTEGLLTSKCLTNSEGLKGIPLRPSTSRNLMEDGPHACPKGLRHGFGVAAVSKGIALNMVQKWLGHAQLTTTAIYANAVGEEVQSIASRMWT
jgi:integrase